jgi:Ser/Thr protein kinase RdoA (MazF antagonist)
MVGRLEHSTQIAELACRQWPCITSAPALFMHRENSVFKVETTCGPAALRIHRHGYHSKAAIQSEMQWMAHLADNGLQVPEPLANQGGGYLAEIQLEGKTYVADLLTWLDGAPLGNSTDPLAFNKLTLEKIFFNLGATIAKLHTVSDAWKVPEGFTRHAWDRDGYVGEQPFWGAFWTAGELSGDHRNILNAARQTAGLELDALKHAGADYGLIHADFVRQNILVTGTDVRIIDFDDSGFGFRMYDFATALVKNRSETHYEAIKQSLFQGYRSRRNLSALDEQSLDVFLALRDFAYLGWMEARRGEPGVEERMPGIRVATLAAAEKFLASQSMI